MRYLIPFAIITLITACGDDGGGKTTSTGGNDTAGTGDTAEVLKTFGEVCETDEECDTGMCLLNEYAAFGFCTADCDEVKEVCAPDSAGNYGGLCIEMPEDFPDTPRRFCAPLCNDIFECQGKTPLWEESKPIEWKGNPLYGELTNVLVCQSPSSHGVIKVDPTTCEDWEASFGEFTKQVNTCKAYCEYLVFCKEVVAPSTYNKTCCAYGCTLEMTKNGEVQEPYEKKIQCYEQTFYAFQTTPLVCEQPLEDCGKHPEDTRPQ